MQHPGDKPLTSAPNSVINSSSIPVRTGAQRYRVLKRLFKPDLLVLQIELQGVVYSKIDFVRPSTIKTWWEDAKPEWMMTYTKN